MKRIAAKKLVRRDRNSVWRELAKLDTLQLLGDSFAGMWQHYRLVNLKNPGGALGPDTEVELTTSRGKPLMRLHISEFVPPKSLSLQADYSAFLFSHHWQYSFELESIDSDTTMVHASFVMIFKNTLLEFCSFLFPFSLILGRRLRHGLQRLDRHMTA